MDNQTAQLVLYAITAVGFAIWLAGLAFLVASARADRPEPTEPADRFILEPEAASIRTGWVSGGTEVPGSAAELSKRLTDALVQPLKTGFQVKIRERTESCVGYEIVGIGPVGVGVHRPRRGTVLFKPITAERTWVAYHVEGLGGRWMLAVAGLFQVLGLAALIGGVWACQAYLLPNPIRRLQVVQMVQAAHLLWPPFLFIGLYRTRNRMIRRGFDTLIGNLPYL